MTTLEGTPMHEIAIYLSGSIKKGQTDTRESFWTDADIEVIRRSVQPLEIHFLNPASRSDDLSDFLGTFGRDLFQVAAADAILVDVRDRRGIGVGSEMTVAKAIGVPVVSWCPDNSHYRRQDFVFMNQQLPQWTHPFVYGLSDVVVDTLQEAGEWLLAKRVWEKLIPKRLDHSGETVDFAIRHYLSRQLARDKEMQAIIAASPRLEEKSRLWATDANEEFE
jgi:hypothetical protein